MAARGGGRGRGRGRGCPNPPITMKELMNTQNQMMQMFMQHMQNNPPAGGPLLVQVRDKCGEFLKGRPPVFTHAVGASGGETIEHRSMQ
jgi:hypothetical protein